MNNQVDLIQIGLMLGIIGMIILMHYMDGEE